MQRKHLLNRRSFLGCAAAGGLFAADEEKRLNFRKLMPPRVPRSAIFRLPDHYVWCASMVRTADGVCHMLFSRWPKSLGFGAWATHSEVAYATAERPEGPYRYQKPALPARGVKHWDGHGSHNPCIIAHYGKFYLYYAGQHGGASWRPDRIATKGEWWVHRNNQRVGVAVADHPSGPWRRFDKPLVDTTPEYGHGITSTPCVMERPTGGFLLVYKTLKPGPGPVGGGVFHYPATSESPLGPFTRYPKPVIDKSKLLGGHFNFHIDDHVEWAQDGRYYAIVKDHDAPFLTEYGRCLHLLESADGLEWRQSEHPLVTEFRLRWDDGSEQRFSRLEMPKLHLEDGQPRVLFLAARPADDPDGLSFNVAIPLLTDSRKESV